MIYEGIILQRNHDLAEVCLPQRRKNRYVFLPERVMELIRPGMRILFMGQEDTESAELYIAAGGHPCSRERRSMISCVAWISSTSYNDMSL